MSYFALVLPRCLIAAAIVFGMVFAPFSIAAACAMPANTAQAAMHCVQDGENGTRMPAKQIQCMGACAGIEAREPWLPVRFAVLPISASPSPVVSLDGILLERDTPPPRFS